MKLNIEALVNSVHRNLSSLLVSRVFWNEIEEQYPGEMGEIAKFRFMNNTRLQDDVHGTDLTVHS